MTDDTNIPNSNNNNRSTQNNSMTREQIEIVIRKYETPVDKLITDIMALIDEPVQESVIQPVYQIEEWKGPNGVYIGTNWYDTKKRVYAGPGGDISSEWASQQSDYSIYAIKVGEEIYRVGDKIVWNWSKGADDTDTEYCTLNKMVSLQSGDLEMTISDKVATGTYRLKYQLTQGFKHYQKPQKEEDKVQCWVGDKIWTVNKTIADSITNVLQQAVKLYPHQDSVQSEQKPLPPVLMVTEDGVSISDPEQIVYKVNKDRLWQISEPKAKNVQKAPQSTMKVFGNSEAHNTFIRDNKPMFSITDIEEQITGKTGHIIERMKKLAQEKLTKDK